MAFAAPGLRAMPSTAAAIALPCARPHRLDAIAMPKAALMGTQWPPAAFQPGVWADNIVLASSMSATSRNSFFVISILLDESPQEVVPGHQTAGLTLQGGIKPVLMLVRHRAADIHHSQQHEDISLHYAHEHMQSHEGNRHQDLGHAQEHHGDLLAGKHIGIKTN